MTSQFSNNACKVTAAYLDFPVPQNMLRATRMLLYEDYLTHRRQYTDFLYGMDETPRDVRVLDNITKKIVFRTKMQSDELCRFEQSLDLSLFVEQYTRDFGYHFYVDIDYKLNPTIDKLTELPAPAMVVNTGGGYHLYWRVAEAFNPEALCAVGKMFGKLLGADTKPNNPKAVLRVGGSLTKDNKLVTVKVYKNNIISCEEMVKLIEATETLPTYTDTEDNPNETITAKQLTVTKFNSLLTRELKDIIIKGPGDAELEKSNHDLSSLDWYVINTLKKSGLTKEEIKWLYTNESFGITKNNDRKANFEYYINRTISRAFAQP